jgi:hypothetical protein
MHFENYGMEKAAMDYYAEMEPGRKRLGCAECPGLCEKARPYGLKIKLRLLHSHDILTA